MLIALTVDTEVGGEAGVGDGVVDGAGVGAGVGPPHQREGQRRTESIQALHKYHIYHNYASKWKT